MSTGFVIGPITLPGGEVLYMSTADDQTVIAGNGDFLVADFGQGGTITVGNGDSDLFATKGDETITTGSGNFVVLTGVNSTVDVGSNDGLNGDQSVVATNQGSNVTVGNGTNIVFMNGTTEQVTTGAGTDVVYALGAGSNTVTFGAGRNWTFLRGYNNVVNDGGGTDTDWMGAGSGKVVTNAAGGTDFLYNFNSSDQIDLTQILAGLNVSLTMAGLSAYVTVTTAPDATYPTLDDTMVTIKGASGTANVSLMDYNGHGLQAMLNANEFALAKTVTI
jgi:hypothetical protein